MNIRCLILYQTHDKCSINGGYYQNDVFKPDLEHSGQELILTFDFVENSCLLEQES